MPLPPYGYGVYWKEYEISTPTFELTPVEKPDMSPFLIHMTGRNELAAILQGRGTSDDIDIQPHEGYLRATVPEVAGVTDNFSAEVVCFTDSPTFALDFFRYRKYDRWRSDQRFGIGFDKSSLISRGVRPVIYTDNHLTRKVISLWHAIQRADEDAVDADLRETLERLYPLLFPLLENRREQGFMWEREWRYPDSNGLVFNHADIRIICCPQNEEASIRDILGDTSNEIEFIRTWQQYDDVTNYLNQQSELWNAQLNNDASQEVRIRQLEQLIQEYRIRINSLNAYEENVNQLLNTLNNLRNQRSSIEERVNELETELEGLQIQDNND